MAEAGRPLIDDAKLFARATSKEALFAAWARVHANGGAAGGDGVGPERFRLAAAREIPRLSTLLVSGAYRPGPLRKVEIPKKSGGTRPLTIPCIIDRVAQTAIQQALSPLLEREFEEASFGYRPGRSVAQAVRRVEALRARGKTFVVDADIERYFERVPHAPLMERLARSLSPGPTTDLIALWLEHASSDGLGLPQGSPLSPLLANLFLDALDEAFGEEAHIVRYADDFVILSGSEAGAQAARRKAEDLLSAQGLKLHAEKTRVVDFDEGFRFLGHLFVRSLVLPGGAAPETLDDVEGLMRLLAERDAAAEADEARAAAEEARRARGGYERDFRLLHLRGDGRRLHIRNMAFVVEEPLADPERPFREILALSHVEVDRIDIGPDARISEAALRHALATDTPIAFTTGAGETQGWLATPQAPNARRHLAQARHALDPVLKLDLARRFVGGRLANQRALLRRMNREAKDTDVTVALTEINRQIRGVPHARDMDALRGREGRGGQVFWPAYWRLLPPGLAPAARIRRRSADIVNLLLDFAASLLARDMALAIARALLHPGFGYLHETTDGRDSLVYDLAEEFRAPLVEAVVAGLVASKGFSRDAFTPRPEGGVRMAREGAEQLIRAYERAAERVVRSPRTGDRRSWRGLMVEQALCLAAHVEGRGLYVPVAMDY
ncbi:CRISPR-associated endonuclease Cas1 [Xanthobacter sp. AM11]|uniref:CRISPR-associated endonuclease Cas1 n=1 Tax=Xanthobacter sp. AM11 TaxID=3380643 RepID=UPI0039BF474B